MPPDRPVAQSHATGGLQWLRSRDAGLSALRRAGRAAIVMPAMLALTEKVIGNATMATFAAFGSLAMLLFVAFGGTMRERLAAQASLILAGAVFICLGTLASRAAWLAAIAMFAVGFGVLFAGVVSSVLASASTSLLLGFILPVTLAGPVTSIPARLGGWLLAGAASLIAIVVLWPAPASDPLRMPLVRACALLARRMRAEVGHVRGGPGTGEGTVDAQVAESAAAIRSLRRLFFATPYRPTGLTTAARILVRLVDELVWLDTILERMPTGTPAGPAFSAVCDVKLAAAALLEQGAALLEAAHGPPDEIEPALRELRVARDTMEQAAMSAISAGRDPAGRGGPGRSGRRHRHVRGRLRQLARAVLPRAGAQLRDLGGRREHPAGGGRAGANLAAAAAGPPARRSRRRAVVGPGTGRRTCSGTPSGCTTASAARSRSGWPSSSPT